MNLSNGSTRRGGGSTSPAILEALQEAELELVCTSYDERLQELLDDAENKPQAIATAVPIDLAEEKGPTALAAAALAAYLARLRGLGIARRKGLDPLLYLLETRNIKAAVSAAPRPGERVAVIAVCGPEARGICERLAQLGDKCTLKDPPGWRLRVTAAATYPLEARVYKPQRLEPP